MSKVYEIVASRIIDQMEQNKTAPWVKPWRGFGLGHSENLLSGHRYRGLNAFLTIGEPTPYFLTFKQAKEIGARIKKGAKSIPIIFWAKIEDEEKDKGFLFARYYRVFNAADLENIPVKFEAKISAALNPTDIQILPKFDVAETVINETRADIRSVENGRAYYSPTLDYINMPAMGLFSSSHEYYSTVFHELGHWTGHDSRLKRKDLLEANYFGSHSYSREELTAELTAAFVCSSLGISTESTERNSAAYLNGWLRRLKGDPKMMVEAAQRAQKASDFILKRDAKVSVE